MEAYLLEFCEILLFRKSSTLAELVVGLVLMKEEQ